MKIFQFKKLLHDFIVEEKISNNIFSNKGKVLYVFFEKKNVTTFDIVYKLMKRFDLKRNNIGIAGLKDKKGITRQRLSIYKNDIIKTGNKKSFLNYLGSLSKILIVKEGNELLKIGQNTSNIFYIRLRKIIDIDNDVISQNLHEILEDIRIYGFPNYYGIQRFGHSGTNHILGKKLILGTIKQSSLGKNSLAEAKFKSQALSSYLFNKYLTLRISEGYLDKFLHGDIIIHRTTKEKLVYDKFEHSDLDLEKYVPTGPCYGYDLLTSEGKVNNNESFQLEMEVLRNNGLNKNDLNNFKKYKIFGIRRPIKEYLINLEYKFNKDDLLLKLELHPGAYASEMIEYFDYELYNSMKH